MRTLYLDLSVKIGVREFTIYLNIFCVFSRRWGSTGGSGGGGGPAGGGGSGGSGAGGSTGTGGGGGGSTSGAGGGGTGGSTVAGGTTARNNNQGVTAGSTTASGGGGTRAQQRSRGRVVRAVGRGRGSGVIVGTRPIVPASVVPEELVNQVDYNIYKKIAIYLFLLLQFIYFSYYNLSFSLVAIYLFLSVVYAMH